MENQQITAEQELQTPKSRKKQEDVTKFTIVELIEKVFIITEDCKLEDKALKKCSPYSKELAHRLSMSEMEAIFLAVIVDISQRRGVDYSDFAHHFRCANIKVMCHASAFNGLVEKGYIMCRQSVTRSYCYSQGISYLISQEAVRFIVQNKPYLTSQISELDVFELFKRFNDLFQQRKEGEIITAVLSQQIVNLMEENKEILFVKKVAKLKFETDHNNESLLVFIYFCHLFINEDEDNVDFNDISKIIDNKRNLARIKRFFKANMHPLQLSKLVEEKRNDGLFSCDSYCLSKEAKEDFLSDFEIDLEQSTSPKKNIIACDSISSKTLFYNEEEGKQIAQLSSLFEDENFKGVQTRLEEQGMRKGFAALFYGSPGTGKTESVLQIARATGRDIVEVNVAQIKSMYIGESEKNIKATFDKYRKAVETADKCPILLFNEADAVLGVRQEGAARAVDKMENSIQNIILQEMENLEGIMIATTNLTKNLDKAFERRFLYKIEFAKPCIEAKQSIWQSMMPTLSEDEALNLAKSYDFSGGQIENIVRKQTVELIISGANPSFEAINNYCKAENIDNSAQRKRIGF